jgi:filamentous hemagglutinin
MTDQIASLPSRVARKSFDRSRLLVGVSLLALLGSMGKVDARGLNGSGSGAVSNPAAVAAAAAAASAQQSSAAGQQAIQSMARAAQSLQGLRSLQGAARAAALAAPSGTVPDGLTPGGLVVAPGAGVTPGVWVGAGAPSQAQANGRTQVEIKQTEQKAILNWSSFNVGRNTDVYFNQAAGGADASNWIALNRVTDPTLAPSRILGTIKAEGQVYVINKNGIVFGGASQINVNSFVASSLSLSDEQFRAGINKQILILDDPSGASIARPQFGYNGQEGPNPYIGLNAPGQVAGVAPGDVPGDVRIEAGAQLTMASGGKALVFAPHVVNSGRISAVDGQVILGAGEQVYLTTDTSGIRGLDVAVSAPMRWVFDYFKMMTASNQIIGGTQGPFQDGLNTIVFPEMAARAASVGYSVVNNGMVKADHGNITLISRTIVQNGALEASTALNNRDGSIRLRAWENGMASFGGDVPPGSLRYWSAGSLTLGSGSVTTSMPDLSDTSEIEQTSLAARYAPGRIEMRGKSIDIEAQASVIVPTGTISIVASTSPLSGETPIVGEPVKRDGSRVYIGEDAYLSVAGLRDMLLTMESNTVTGELRINELRDSPLYRDSWLRGKTISVDKRVAGLFTDGPMSDVQWIAGSPGAWVGTPIGDFSGWIGVGKTTLGELSANAAKGLIVIKSSGSIITRQGSLLDVSGGSVRYQDGYITTTKLLGANGRIYDIGAAMPDQLYTGLAGSFSRTHNIQGKVDPRLTETWSSILDRNTSRRFEPGYREGRAAGSIQFFAAEAMVLEGSYWGGVVTGERQAESGKLATAGSFTIGGGSDEHRQWLIGNLIIDDQPKLLPAGFTSKSVLDPIWYVAPPASDPSVRQKITYLDSDVLADAGMSRLTFMVSTGFTLAKDEKLELAAGTAFSVFANVGAISPATFAIDGSIRIAGGSVALAGTQTSTFGATADIDVSGVWFNGPRSGLPPVIKGGSINVSGDFASGVTLDVSGGGWYDTTGIKPKLKLGDAGALIIAPTRTAQLAGLDLRGYSAASGGTISVVSTGSIRIGGAAPTNPAIGWLADTLFAERGFRGFDLTTTGDVIVADGAIISQLPLSVDLSHVNFAVVASGARIGDIGPLAVLPLFERVTHKPTSLRLAGANVVIGTGAAVNTDVLGSITLAANGNPGTSGTSVSGNLTVRGTLEAPAGAISLQAEGDLKLAAGAQILARGMAVVQSGIGGLRSGSVLAGGSVGFDKSSTMTLENGSLVDVSGASGTFDLDRGRNGAEAYTLASNGGSISLKFGGEAKDVVDATLLAQAGGAGATGGHLNIAVASVPKPGSSYSLPYTLYYRDRRDGVIKALDLNEGYYLDLDIYREYSSGGDPAFEFWNVLSQIEQATGLNRTGGLAFVNLKSDTSPGTVNQPLSLIMPRLIDQLDLLSRHFYVDAAATIPVSQDLPSVNVRMTKISADAVNGGGFGTLTTSSSVFMVAPGVDLAVGKSISIGSPIVSGGAGAASISAPYIQILSGNGMAAAAGSGKLTVTADLIDVTRATFSGFAETRLVTGDLRIGAFIGGVDGTEDRRSYLTADGLLTLQAAQIYPATGIVASIKAGTQLDIVRNSDNGLPLSAAGTLNLLAPVIMQGGVVRAPFGSITMTATDSITLGAGSITSVSGDGLILPYGTLSNNEFWNAPAVTQSLQQEALPLGRLPEKNIVLQGPKVTLATGSVVDIRGGGNLFAWEHVPGPGGSHDLLAQPGMYAIMPGLNASAASQQKVWLAGGNGLAAGWYALLPARYALLPGAFAVSMVKGSASALTPNTVTMADGSTTMAGRLADSHGGGFDQLVSSWRVMSGTTLRSYSEYNEAYANTYFASDAFKLGQYRLTGVDVVTPRMPVDGGAVVFEATSSLVLDGTLQSQPALGGRGGLVDISGSKIAIVGAGMDRSDLAGYLVIDATSLSSFGAGSVLIGGVRHGDARGVRIDVAASDVLVRNDASSSLTGPEILLAAIGEVRVAEGSVIVAAGHSPGSGVDLVIAPRFAAVYGDANGHNDYDPRNDVLISPARDYGALIRVSVSDAVNVLREKVDTSTGGIVTIGANATLSGGNALLLDATQNTVVAGSARLSGAAMSLASGRIGFGGGTGGLVFDAASLAQLANTQALTLRSYSTMDFYTSVNLGGAGLDKVVFDAAGIVGYGAGAIDVTGKAITLQNSGATLGNPAAAGTVRLSLNADEIVLGSGAKVLRGFDTVTLNAGRQITGQGNGSIDAGTASVTLVSPVVTGRGGASQSLTTQNAIRILAGGGAPIDSPEASLGARLSFTGTSVELGGRIVALGGSVNLASTAGDVTIGHGGTIDVGGFRKQFFDVAQYADAGSITLTAAGSVVVAPGGMLQLSAHADGGAAGRLSLASNGGTVVLGGRIEAHAAAGQTGGSFSLDIAALPDFAAQSQFLNAAGFSASRQFRIRSGDVVVDGLTQVADFSLIADQGSVTLAGTIDARSGYGGRISVSAGNGLTMLNSALLQAGATGEFGGGRVTLEASGGQLDIRGGVIDVAGGDGGRVRFRALQSAGHSEIEVARMQAAIVGARSAVLEGVWLNANPVTTIDAALRDQANAVANDFMTHAGDIASRLQLGQGIVVASGIEIRSQGDLTLGVDWDLSGLVSREGGLTLRAGGNLVLLGNISDGFSSAAPSGVLQNAASWDLRLVAGADLTSASALSLKPLASLTANSGTLTVGSATAGNVVRTGSGDIDIVAGRDLLLAHNTSAIYTAGRADQTVYADFVTPTGATYGIGGGNLRIAAQGSATSVLPANPDDNQLFMEWLRKVGSLDENFVFEANRQSSWWIDYANFQQGVGALGGGNVTVKTGGDLVNMLVALPTNGRVRGGRSNGEAMLLEMRNGGLMQVEASGAVRAGYYYVGRGEGVINAGEFANGRTVSALLAQGNVVYNIAPVLALGDAAMKVKTSGDLMLQTVMDPLLLNSDAYLLGGITKYNAYMSGYTDRTSLELLSVGGSVSLANQGRFLSKQLDLSGGSYGPDVDYSLIGLFATNLYPSVTRIAALNGSVINQNRMFTAPGANSELRILAERDVVLGEITMSRANPAMVPSPLRPYGGLAGAALQLRMETTPRDFQSVDESGFASLLLNELEARWAPSNGGALRSYLESVRNPLRLVNANDIEPSRIFAKNGSITGSLIDTAIGPTLGKVTTNEQTWFRAGTDIRNIDYRLRNLHRTDVSVLEAGTDIIGGKVDIQGPGAILLAAGRDVYGTTFQIFSAGNFDNYEGSTPEATDRVRAVALSEVRGLAKDGASISVMAGLKGKQPSYDALAAMYLDPANLAAMPDYLKGYSAGGVLMPLHWLDLYETRGGKPHLLQTGMAHFVYDMTGEYPHPADLWDRFRALPVLTQQRFLRQVYFNELKAAGDDQNRLDADNRPLNGGYQRGYTAIEALLPGQAWSGNIQIGSSTFRTMAGGSIETLTPGGGMQVAALGTVVPDGAGLVTFGGGGINIFARDSVTVNRSRVLTFGGGDEVIWSTLGDIDAGRGAKTTRVPSPPDITTSDDAVTKVQERPDIGGSGIGTVIGFGGVEEGDVTLVAPRGTVDAGDAGIRVSGNFTVAALVVLNAENIKVGGESKGVPKAASAPVSLNVDTKDKAAADAIKDATQTSTGERPSVIIVEVLGYGGGNDAAPQEKDPNRDREDQRSYNTNGLVQMVGAGSLNSEQSQALTEEEKKRLQEIGRKDRR